MHKTRYTGDRSTELLTYYEAHPRYYVESGVKGKTETKVQKASYPIGSLMQGMKAHRRQVRHPDFKPEIGLDKWAGHGAKPLSTCFSGFQSWDRISPSFMSLSINAENTFYRITEEIEQATAFCKYFIYY